MKINTKNLFFVLLGINVLLVGATLAVFAVASSVAQKKSERIAQLKIDNQSNDELLGYYTVLQGTLKANKDLQAIAEKVLPTDKDQSAAFADIDKFSKSTKVPIQQVTFKPGTNKLPGKTLTSPSGIKGVSVIAVTLSCVGVRYENLLNFLKAIETTQRRMQVSSINITPDATTPSLLAKVDLSVDIYLKVGN